MLVILSGVAGAGKDTIKKELIKRMENVVSLPSFTDRNQRVGEEPGVIYNFVTTEEFERMIKDGELYEIWSDGVIASKRIIELQKQQMERRKELERMYGKTIGRELYKDSFHTYDIVKMVKDYKHC